MKFLLYRGRHGEEILTEHGPREWDYLMRHLIEDDGSTPEASAEMGLWVDGGTFEQGFVSVDDGGRIDTIWLTEVR